MMMRRAQALALMAALLQITPLLCTQESANPVTATDCVQVRYPWMDLDGIIDYYHSPVQFNPAHTEIAYFVKSPNIERNENVITLRVKAVTDSWQTPARTILTGSGMAHLTWLADNRSIVTLAKIGARIGLVEVDVATGRRGLVARSAGDIVDYSIDSKGSTVAFSVRPRSVTSASPNPARMEPDDADGIRIPYQPSEASTFQSVNEKVFITRRLGINRWTQPRAISVASPGGDRRVSELLFPRLSLSPTGEVLLITYLWTGEIPGNWSSNPSLKELKRREGGLAPTVIYNLGSGESRLAIESPSATSIPFWSADSRSYVVTALAPPAAGIDYGDTPSNTHLYWENSSRAGLRELRTRSQAKVNSPSIGTGTARFRSARHRA